MKNNREPSSQEDVGMTLTQGWMKLELGEFEGCSGGNLSPETVREVMEGLRGLPEPTTTITILRRESVRLATEVEEELGR